MIQLSRYAIDEECPAARRRNFLLYPSRRITFPVPVFRARCLVSRG